MLDKHTFCNDMGTHPPDYPHNNYVYAGPLADTLIEMENRIEELEDKLRQAMENRVARVAAEPAVAPQQPGHGTLSVQDAADLIRASRA